MWINVKSKNKIFVIYLIAKINHISLLHYQENLPLLEKEAEESLAHPGEPLPSLIVPISAKTGQGMPTLVKEMRKLAEDSGFLSDEEDL